MNATLAWLTCLVKGHRYDITEISPNRLTYCACCGRELFKRASYILPRPAPTTTLGLHTSSLGEGQSTNGGEGPAPEAEEITGSADAEQNLIEAINAGRLTASKGHAIAWQRKSLEASPQHVHYNVVSGLLDPLPNTVVGRRFWITYTGNPDLPIDERRPHHFKIMGGHL